MKLHKIIFISLAGFSLLSWGEDLDWKTCQARVKFENEHCVEFDQNKVAYISYKDTINFHFYSFRGVVLCEKGTIKSGRHCSNLESSEE